MAKSLDLEQRQPTEIDAKPTKFRLVCKAYGSLYGNYGLESAFWYLASPLWIDRMVSETLVQSSEREVISTGVFPGVDGLHQASGHASQIVVEA